MKNIIKYLVAVLILISSVSTCKAQRIKNEKEFRYINDSLLVNNNYDAATRLCDSVLKLRKFQKSSVYSIVAKTYIDNAFSQQFIRVDSIRSLLNKAINLSYLTGDTALIHYTITSSLKICSVSYTEQCNSCFYNDIKKYIDTAKNKPLELLAWYHYSIGQHYNKRSDSESALENFKYSCHYFEEINNYTKAMDACFKIIRMISMSGYDDIAASYWYNTLLRLHQSVVESGQSNFNTELPYYRTLARYHSYTKNYTQALAAYDSSIIYYDQKLQKMHDDPSSNFNRYNYINLTAYNYAYRIQYLENLGREDAIDTIAKFADDSCNIVKDDLACLQFLLGRHYNNINNFDKAYKYYHNSYINYSQAYGDTNFITLKAIHELISSAITIGKYYEADTMVQKATAIYNIGANNSGTIKDALFHELKAKLYFYTERYNEAQNELMEAQNIIQELLDRNFGFMSQEAISDMWNRADISCSHMLLTALALGDKITEEFAIAVFNSILAQKRLLFLSQNRLKKIAESNPNLLKLYKDVSSIKSILTSDKNNITGNQRDSLYQIMRNGELKLLAADTLPKRIQDLKSTNFNSIRSKLSKGELLVEFTEIYEYDKDFQYLHPELCNNQYVAIAFSCESTAPIIIPMNTRKEFGNKELPNGHTLREALINRTPDNVKAIYSDSILTSMIWDSILYRFPDTHTIYFSPNGYFHAIALGNLYRGNGQIVQDNIKIVRIYYSASICNAPKPSDRNTIAIYGGISYSNHDIACNDTTQSDQNSIAIYGGITYRKSGVTSLPYTYEECDYIRNKALKSFPTVEFHTGTSATKETLKAYSGQSPTVLHIATHGWTNNITSDSTTLEHSGLSFANGDITAAEISELNLSNTKLTVLSACETGLGSVKSDGLFGLERGFKLAGVDKIMISLWNIADDATAYFMKKFYYYYFAGHSARESLNYARETLRKGNRFSHPYYWAGFVLVE